MDTYAFVLTLADLVIGFNPVTYQVSEIQGQVEVCFTVRENQLAIPAQAILNTQIGSATCTFDYSPYGYVH